MEEYKEKIWENKKIGSLLDLSRFEVDQKAEETYAHYVSLTAKLLKRPYITVHKMVEDWPIDKIVRHYDLSTKHAGDMPPAVKWWWLRKKELKRD